MQPFLRGCWDAQFILGPLHLCAGSRCWGIDKAQWWTGTVSPAANQKVNSLSIEKGKWPPGLQPAHLSSSRRVECNRFWLLSACVQDASILSQPVLHVSVSADFLTEALSVIRTKIRVSQILLPTFSYVTLLPQTSNNLFDRPKRSSEKLWPGMRKEAWFSKCFKNKTPTRPWSTNYI